MKTKLLSLFVALIATTALWASNVITYTATEKLEEVTFSGLGGLLTDAFNVAITSHTFSNGTGTITFADDVTTIGGYAFYGCSGLISVTIPNSVTTIGYYAFYGCSGLISVTIPNSVTTIGRWAFHDVNDIVYNGTATGSPWDAKCVNGYVDGYLVYNDATKTTLCGCSSAATGEITIPNSVTTIGNDAFISCRGLTTINIPNSVTSIGKYAFYNCSGLTSITIPNSVTTIGNGVFGGCIGLTSVTIPNSVTTIGDYAFRSCSGLTSVTIPSSVATIGDNAFYDCFGLTSVTIPNSVTTIGERAFDGCSGLTSVTIGNSVTTIGVRAFDGCNNIKSVIWNAKNCNGWNFGSQVETFVLGDSVEVIPNNLCKGMDKLTTISIPTSAKTIGNDAFYGCSGLISVTIPNSVTTIGNSAFKDCNGLTLVTLGNSVKTIGDEAFSNCSGITSVTIPNSVTSIGTSAFRDCSSLTSITIPDSVTTIEEYTFSGCKRLTSISIPNSVTKIGASAFRDCSSLISITIPDPVITIEEYAFSNCKGLTLVTINSNTIVSRTYSKSNNINSIFGKQVKEYTIGHSVTKIGSYAFYGCNDLASITIGNSVTTIGTNAFSGCDNVKSVIWNAKNCNGWNFGNQVETFLFGSEVEKIPANLCKNMLLLQSVVIPSEVTSIGDYAFAGCQGLKQDLVLSNKIVTIGEHAFEGCKNITSVDFSASLDFIGDSAFAGCYRIDNMTCPTSRTPDITEHTFDNVSRYAYLYVLQEHERKFKIDPYWGVFDIKTIGAGGSSTVDDDQVSVDPHDNNADVTWPANNEAEGYSLTITKDGAIFCVLTFNGKGQLTGLAFAPGREGAHPVPAATLSSKGYTFRVTGLDRASKYGLGLDVKDKEEQVIKTYTSAFATTGYVPQNFTIAVNANNNAMGTVTGSGTFEEFTSVTLTAIPNEHYHFVQWSDGNTNNPRTITVEDDATYTALFAIDQFTISVVAENGSVTGAGTYDYGTEVTLTAIPNEGYEFVNWSNGIKDNPYTFIVEQDVDLTANFKKVDTGWQDTHSGVKATKYFHNGNLVIERNGVRYTPAGQKVR